MCIRDRFKRAYARYALAAGLTSEQAVRVYSFETGGTGNYDVQSGIEQGGKRAISTAIGYNQLLTTNSVELMAEQGDVFVKDLTQRAATLAGPARAGPASVAARCVRSLTKTSPCSAISSTLLVVSSWL